MNNESYVIRKERCPECARIGNDRSGDNLAVYSDGHCYCYRCSYTTGRRHLSKAIDKPIQGVVLPADVTTQLPIEARQWLEQYQLSRLDLMNNHVMWSDKYSRIIFPYFSDMGLWAWQGRYVGKETDKAKWKTEGEIKSTIHQVKVCNREAILVEDIVSAIKVSKFAGAIPIFGSSVNAKQILRLKTVVDKVRYWLDPDMRTKSVKMANLSTLLGLPASVIFSDKDPKEHDYDSIANILRET